MNVTRLGEGAPGSDDALNALVAKRDETHELLEKAKAANDTTAALVYENRMNEIAVQIDAIYAKDQEYFANPVHEEEKKTPVLPILALAATAYMVLK